MKHDPIPTLGEQMGDALEAMLAIQMTAYPEDWSEADKREVAMKHLGWSRPTPEIGG